MLNVYQLVKLWNSYVESIHNFQFAMVTLGPARWPFYYDLPYSFNPIEEGMARIEIEPIYPFQ